MSKPWVLQDLMTAVDDGYAHNIDSDKQVIAPRRSTMTSHGRGRKGAPAPAPACPDTSFEFSAAVSYSPASPASMVFSGGQLRAHQFPAVRYPSAPATGGGGSSLAASPVRRRSASTGSGGGARMAGAGATKVGSKKRVSFAVDAGADRMAAAAGGGQGKKSGGLLGCMASTCRSSRNEVVEPARNANRKVVAV